MTVKVAMIIDSSEAEQVDNTREVHYRVIYSKSSDKAFAVCVQDFDYFDYEEFIGDACYAHEEDAEEAARLINMFGVHSFRTKQN